MIGKAKQKDGDSGRAINYIIGGKKENSEGKEIRKMVRVVDYNDFALPSAMRREINIVPTTAAGWTIHKKALAKIAKKISLVFNSRALLADSRVNKPFEEYVLGYSPEDLPNLTPALRRTVVREFLEGMGIHGEIDVTHIREGKEVKEKLHRDAMYLACSHMESNAPHEHVFTCRVDADGKVNNTRNERWRSLKVCRAISKKYGLHLRPNGAEVTEKNGYTLCKKDYSVCRDRANSGYNLQLQMRDAVMKCLEQATSWGQLENDLLNNYGIDVEFLSHEVSGEIYGVEFMQMSIGKRKGEMIVTRKTGSQLYRGVLSYGKICEKLKANALACQTKEEKKTMPAPKPKPNKDDIKEVFRMYLPMLYDFRKYASDAVNVAKKYSDDNAILCQASRIEEELRYWEKYEGDVNLAETGENVIYMSKSFFHKANCLSVATVDLLVSLCDTSRTKCDYKERVAQRQQVDNMFKMIFDFFSRQKTLGEKKELSTVRSHSKELIDNFASGCEKLRDRLKQPIPKPSVAETVETRVRKVNLNVIPERLNSIFNGSSSHPNYVILNFVATKEGVRAVIGNNGYISAGDTKIYNPTDPKLQDYGECYVDFTINEKNELVGVIEVDPWNYYTLGFSGEINCSQGTLSLGLRKYRGSAEAHRKKLEDHTSMQNIRKKSLKKVNGRKMH